MPAETTATSAMAAAAPGTDAGMSMATLAAQLGQGRQQKEKQSTATAAAIPANEGPGTGEAVAPGETNLSAEGASARPSGEAETAEAERLAALTPEERTAEESATEEARVAALTPEERAAEEAAAAEAEAAEGEEPLDLTHVPKLSPEQKQHVGEMFRERIGKAKAKYMGEAEALVATERTAREAAEAQAAELRGQLEQAQQSAPAGQPVGAEPLAQVTTAAQLAKAVSDAQAVKGWAKQHLIRLKRNPDAVLAALKEQKIELSDESPEGVEEWLSEAEMRAEQVLTVDAPKRQQYLQQQAQYHEQALKAFPFLKDPKSSGYADAMGVLAVLPELKRLPHWELAIGIYARGFQVVKAEQAAAAAAAKNGKAKPAAKPPANVTVRPATAGRQITPEKAGAKQAEEKFKATGSVDALAGMFASRRQ